MSRNFTLRELAGVLYGRAPGIDKTPSERVVERLPLHEKLRVAFQGFDQRLAGRDRGWFLYGPDTRLPHDIAGTLGNGSWGYIVGTYDEDAGPTTSASISAARGSRR